jgi:VanZ family protein
MPGADGGRTARVLRAIGRFFLWIPAPFALLLTVAWGLLIFDLSAHPVPIRVHPNLYWEFLSNLAHAPLFGVLTLLLSASVLREPDGAWPRPRRARSALVLGSVLAYGILDELHQSRTPGRDASFLDVLTDGVSSAVVLWIVFTLGRAELEERMLLRRLGVGAGLCFASAGLAMLS